MGEREWGGWWGRVGSRRQVMPSTRTQAAVLCLSTTHILISAFSGPKDPVVYLNSLSGMVKCHL